MGGHQREGDPLVEADELRLDAGEGGRVEQKLVLPAPYNQPSDV